jgi:hypothetical protein
VVSLWLLMKNYSDHPMLSAVGCATLLLAILGSFALGLLGKTRPDEVPEKTLTHITRLGVVVAAGIGSQKDMVQLLREFSGLKRLPTPTHSVRGSAANPADYVSLTVEESDAVSANIEMGVEKLLEDAVKNALASAKQAQLPQASEANATEPPTPESSLVKGKKL